MINEIISSVFDKSAEFIEKLKEQGSIVNTGAIINFQHSEIEYRLQLDLGDIHSRPNKFKNMLASLLVKDVNLEVFEISGIGIPNNENLVQLGLIRMNQSLATIDFPKILLEIKSNLLIITFRKAFPKELRDKLVYRNIGRTGIVEGNTLRSNMEIVLDYANLWYSQFQSFSIRNIVFTLTMNLEPEFFMTMISKELRTKLTKSDKLALENDAARKFLSTFQKVANELQSPEFLSKMEECIKVEPENHFMLSNVGVTVKPYYLPKSGWPITLPSTFLVSIIAKIDDRQTSIHGISKLDNDKFEDLLKQVFDKIKHQVRNIDL